MMLCFGVVSCRSTAAEDAETVGASEVMEIPECVLSVPCVLVTPDVLDSLPESVRNEAKKFCGKPGVAVIASSMRPRYFRLIRRQERFLLGGVETKLTQNTVYLSIVSGLGDAADSIRSIALENPDSPDPWNLGVFIKRYPELADRIGGLPLGDERLAALDPAARELLKRGSTRVMLERHSREKDPAALEDAVQAEQEQIGALEDILNSN